MWIVEKTNEGRGRSVCIALSSAFHFGESHCFISQRRFRLFTSAAEKGHAEAIYALGMCYRDSDGVEEDSSKVKIRISLLI